LETSLIPDDPRELPDWIWCVAVRNLDTEEEWQFGPHALEGALTLLVDADLLIGHNIARFDVPMIQKLCPGWLQTKEIKMFDTLAASRLIYASNHLSRSIAFRKSAGRDAAKQEAKLPGRLLKAHSLESWGYRLGLRKDMEARGENPEEFFSKYSDKLMEYCVNDVRLNARLADYLLTEPAEKGWPLTPLNALINESHFSYLLGMQERNGVGFDEGAGVELYSKLIDIKAELTHTLREAVPPWTVLDDLFMPKRDNSKYGYKKGVAFQKSHVQEFNPGSNQQVGDRLMALYGWEPTLFTEGRKDKDGEHVEDSEQPIVNEDVLASLDFPIIPQLLEYITIKKRLGQLGDGENAWLKKVTEGGLIHGRIHATGTRTSRCSHSKPNLGQVPKVTSPYGKECRSLFTPTRPGLVMVGADAAGIQLRMLAHRMAFFDKGAFAKQLLEGDPHAAWQKLTGVFERDFQKTFTYAFLFGAGDGKLGQIMLDDWRAAYANGTTPRKPPSGASKRSLGRGAKSRLLQAVPALDALLTRCRAASKRGWIKGLDGRVIACQTEHGALNDVLQLDEAVVMKHAAVRLVDRLGADLGLRCWPLLNVHDEWQFETAPEAADGLGALMVESIVESGVELGLRIPLDGAFKVGNNWMETH
jgi:hypothetical protein